MGAAILIIAEAGVNHNGCVARARQMVDAAAQAGADIVKFQTFVPEALVAADAPKAEYQIQQTGSDSGQLDMLKNLVLSPADLGEMKTHGESQGIEVLSTPFDDASIQALAEIGFSRWKIPSGEITNLPYLRRIGAFNQEIILSTGMSTVEEVAAAVAALEQAGTPRGKITLLHCNTQYPTPMSDVNLRAMHTLREAFPCVAGVGYSDHTLGIEIPIAAAALGATVIEKHFTLDRTLPGPDHQASLEPTDLAAMVTAVRHIEEAMGTGNKAPSASERPNMPIARKSIVASRAIAKGEIFSPDNLTTKRPGTGVSPMEWDDWIGKAATRNYEPDEVIG